MPAGGNGDPYKISHTNLPYESPIRISHQFLPPISPIQISHAFYALAGANRRGRSSLHQSKFGAEGSLFREDYINESSSKRGCSDSGAKSVQLLTYLLDFIRCGERQSHTFTGDPVDPMRLLHIGQLYLRTPKTPATRYHSCKVAKMVTCKRTTYRECNPPHIHFR